MFVCYMFFPEAFSFVRHTLSYTYTYLTYYVRV